MATENGVWRTISGRRVFIKEGQSLTDAMRESGKFGEDKTRIFNKKDFQDAKKLTEKIVEDQEFAYYGLRVQENDSEKIGGIIEHTSKNFGGDFEGSEKDGEDLDGVSSIKIDSVSEVNQFGGYEGKIMYLLGADEGEYGYDPGEFIMKDAKVLAKIKVEKGKLQLSDQYKKSGTHKIETKSSTTKESSQYAGTSAQVKEYTSFKAEMTKKYGGRLWREMTDSEYDKMERLERIAYRGK